MGAMLDMMGQMMGKKPGSKPSDSPQGGEGTKGDSKSANTDNKGKQNNKSTGERRIPRAAGKSGTQLPPEFQKALDGYNKKAQTK